jgi:hypothetical protein
LRRLVLDPSTDVWIMRHCITGTRASGFLDNGFTPDTLPDSPTAAQAAFFRRKPFAIDVYRSHTTPRLKDAS